MFCHNGCDPVLFYFVLCRYSAWLSWRGITWRAITRLEARSHLCFKIRLTVKFMKSPCRATPPISAPSLQMLLCCRRSSLSSFPATSSWCWWGSLGTTCCCTSSAEPERCTMSPTFSSETWRFQTCSCVSRVFLSLWPTPSTHMGGFLVAQCATWCSSSNLSQCMFQSSP